MRKKIIILFLILTLFLVSLAIFLIVFFYQRKRKRINGGDERNTYQALEEVKMTSMNPVEQYGFIFPHKKNETIEIFGKDLNPILNFSADELLKQIENTKPLVGIQWIHESEILRNEILQEHFFDKGYLMFDDSDLNHIYLYCPNDSHCLVPRTVFSFWTSSNPITAARRESIQYLKDHLDANFILVTPDTMYDYILKAHPLHPAFKYLSAVHKADYLRTYFMNFYGGGYTDIKKNTGSWSLSFFDLIENKNKIANGYQELDTNSVAYKPHGQFFKDLIGNGCYIFRPNTALTNEWYSTMMKLLDFKLQALEKNPAKHPYDTSAEYPIRWEEMLGEIFHKVCYFYKDQLLKSVPVPVFLNYR